MALPLASNDEKIRVKGLGRRFGSCPCTSWKTSLKVPHFSSADSLQNSAPSFPLWPSFQAYRMWTGQPTFMMRSILWSSPWTYHRLTKSQEDP